MQSKGLLDSVVRQADGPREGKLIFPTTRCYIEMPTTGLSSRAGRALQCLEHNYLGLVLQFRYLLPTRIGQCGRVGHENQHDRYK